MQETKTFLQAELERIFDRGVGGGGGVGRFGSQGAVPGVIVRLGRVWEGVIINAVCLHGGLWLGRKLLGKEALCRVCTRSVDRPSTPFY